MHGDPAPPGEFQRRTAALPAPSFACFLGCTKAWCVCRQRAHCCPGSLRAWGGPEAMGNPDLVHVPMRPSRDPSAGSTGLLHGTVSRPQAPLGGSGCV